jgi:hypothetical protein
LPQILADGGSAGEREESMMWYALNHEKGYDGEDGMPVYGRDLWMNDSWKAKWWLEKQEHIFSFLFLASSFLYNGVFG